jgi:hypothetical protein
VVAAAEAVATAAAAVVTAATAALGEVEAGAVVGMRAVATTWAGTEEAEVPGAAVQGLADVARHVIKQMTINLRGERAMAWQMLIATTCDAV